MILSNDRIVDGQARMSRMKHANTRPLLLLWLILNRPETYLTGLGFPAQFTTQPWLRQ